MPRLAKTRLYRCHGVPWSAIDNRHQHPAPYPKVAFVISKKEAKLSPQRNLVKRRYQEALKAVLKSASPNLKAKIDKYYGLICLLKADIATMPYPELIEHIRESLDKD